MRFSYPDYMGERIQQALTDLVYTDKIPVKVLAELAGVSESQIRQAINGEYEIKGKYVFALASALAERWQNFRIINVLLPGNARIALTEEDVMANGSCDDEAAEGTVALAQAVLGGRGKDPEAIAEARRQLRRVERQLGQEEKLLRGASADAD